jgi:hypothetical protein
MGNDNHVVSHKLCGFQGHVGGHIVMLKEAVVVAPKFQSFSLHIFSEFSRNITVKVRVDCSVRRNKFMVNNPLHVQRNYELLLKECSPKVLRSISGVSVTDLPSFTQNLMQTHCSILLFIADKTEQNKTRSQKNTRVKMMHVHSAVSRGGLMQ